MQRRASAESVNASIHNYSTDAKQRRKESATIALSLDQIAR
jgi:hypothetical protein